MSSSMIHSVLEIEREAGAVLAKAEADAGQLLADAGARRETDGRAHAEAVARDVKQLEENAAAERDAKVRELTAGGEAALSVVRNISDAAFDNGVQHIMKTLKTTR